MPRPTYTLPIATLKKARAAHAKGITRLRVAEEILKAMEQAAAKNPTLRSRLAYLQCPRHDAIAILMQELKISDPRCPEHKGWKKMLARARNKRCKAKKKKRMQTDPEYAEAERKRRRERERERKATEPGYKERCQKYQQDYATKIANDFFRMEEHRVQDRERYAIRMANPEYRAAHRIKNREKMRKYKAKLQEDPVAWARFKANKARWERERIQRMREEDPEGYARYVAKKREQHRQWKRENPK